MAKKFKGTHRNDYFSGTHGNDRFIGSFGNDTIKGFNGYDVVDYSHLNQAITLKPTGVIEKGNSGKDKLNSIEEIIGAAGKSNTIDARSATGKTSIDVNLGHNRLTVKNIPNLGNLKFTVKNFVNVFGTRNADKIVGNSQNNILKGNDGSDTLDGNRGNDNLDGGYGNDKLRGGYGNDTIYGGNGNDKLYGNRDNDKLYGGYGNDSIYGGKGNDILLGTDEHSAGLNQKDSLRGGLGHDTFVLASSSRGFYSNQYWNDKVTIHDFNVHEDTIRLNDGSHYKLGSSSGNTYLYEKVNGHWDGVAVLENIHLNNHDLSNDEIFEYV